MIVLVPIDNRPVTYAFPQLIARIAGIDAVVPPKDMLGSSPEELSLWLDKTLQEKKPEGLAICLDSILYGGLVASRRSSDAKEVLLKRAENICKWKKTTADLKVLAQSSIMRISDNYHNEKEKSYWSEYGREIFSWSELLYKQKHGRLNDDTQLKQVEEKISPEVRKDYLESRKRNFEVNLKLVEYAKTNCIDVLILSQDDTGKYGLNVLEREELVQSSKQQGLSNVLALSGTDEMLMLLICRYLIEKTQRTPHCSIQFNQEENSQTPSNYEGQTIEESVRAQIRAAGLEEAPQGDFAVIVHAAKTMQGDHIWLPELTDRRKLDTTTQVKATLNLLEKSPMPCVICDVAYSNGSDPTLVEALLAREDLLDKLWGYAGWNTSGNAIGTALAMGVARWYTSTGNAGAKTDMQAFEQAMFIRFADDWAYQSQVRSNLTQPSQAQLEKLMSPYLDRLAPIFNIDKDKVQTSFPWQRTFEVEVSINAQ